MIGRMVNGMAILAGFEFMSERLAVALDSGDQEDEHSCFSDTTKQDFVYDLAGIKQVWTGDNEGGERAGLNDLVRSQDAALADRVDGLLADAETKVAALGDPWDQVLATPKDSPERKAAEEVVVRLCRSWEPASRMLAASLGFWYLFPRNNASPRPHCSNALHAGFAGCPGQRGRRSAVARDAARHSRNRSTWVATEPGP